MICANIKTKAKLPIRSNICSCGDLYCDLGVFEFIFEIQVVIGSKFGFGFLQDPTPDPGFMSNTNLDLGSKSVRFGVPSWTRLSCFFRL